MILSVHHAQITIPKGAEAEAREFYCEFLGLKEVPKPESLQGSRRILARNRRVSGSRRHGRRF